MSVLEGPSWSRMQLSLRFFSLRGYYTRVYEVATRFFCEINNIQFTLDLISLRLVPHLHQRLGKRGLTELKSETEH